MGMPPLPPLQPASCLSVLFLHPAKFLVEDRVLHLLKKQKKKQYKPKNGNPTPLIFFKGANYISRCEVKVKVLCLACILMSHLKYLYLELNSL